MIESLITLLFSLLLSDYGASPVVRETVNDFLNHIYRHSNRTMEEETRHRH